MTTEPRYEIYIDPTAGDIDRAALRAGITAADMAVTDYYDRSDAVIGVRPDGTVNAEAGDWGFAVPDDRALVGVALAAWLDGYHAGRRS